MICRVAHDDIDIEPVDYQDDYESDDGADNCFNNSGSIKSKKICCSTRTRSYARSQKGTIQREKDEIDRDDEEMTNCNQTLDNTYQLSKDADEDDSDEDDDLRIILKVTKNITIVRRDCPRTRTRTSESFLTVTKNITIVRMETTLRNIFWNKIFKCTIGKNVILKNARGTNATEMLFWWRKS